MKLPEKFASISRSFSSIRTKLPEKFAFNTRTFSSIGLVALVVGVYCLFSGGVKAVPTTNGNGETFGSDADSEGSNSEYAGEVSDPVANGDDKESAESVIGIQPSDEEVLRTRQIEKRGRLFDPDTPDPDGEDGKPINKDNLVQGVEIKSHRDEWMLLRSEKRKADTLAAIEDRLSMKRTHKKHFKVSNGDPQ